VQAFLADDPVDKAQRFEREIGWHEHRDLYDVQGRGVREALGRGAAPDPAQRITGTDWFMPKWKEQPPSRYAVTGGPAEDMAETLTMFVRARSTLGERSPARLAWATAVLAALRATGAAGSDHRRRRRARGPPRRLVIGGRVDHAAPCLGATNRTGSWSDPGRQR
jgi:hypothetical protein